MKSLDVVGTTGGKATTEVVKVPVYMPTHKPPTSTSIERIEALSRAGFTVSVCCGPSGVFPMRWSVNVLSPAGHEFARPYAAKSFDHAIEIAETEIEKRGWR